MSEDVLATGLNIRAKPDSKSDKLGLLPRGARIEIGERSTNGKWGKIKQLLEGKIVPVFIGQEVPPDASMGWVYLGELDVEHEPEALDQIVALEKPYPIKAGELIGYLGEYQEYIDAQPVAKRGVRPMLHVEIFSGDDVKAFIKKSREYAKKIPTPTSGLFVIEKGAKLVSPRASDITLGPTESVLPAAGTSQSAKWIKVYRVQLKIMEKAELGTYDSAKNTYSGGALWNRWYVGARNDQRTQNQAESKKLGYTRREVWMATGEPIWVERESWNAGSTQKNLGQSIPAWTKFPLDLKNQNTPPADLTRVISSAELAKIPAEEQVVDAAGHHWWHVSIRTNTDPKAPTNYGWVCEKDHALAHWQSPWAWPGFELVEENADPMTFLQSTLLKAGIAKKDEVTDFKARADSLDSGEMFQKIYQLLDANKDKHLDKEEIKKALQQPLLAQSMSKIIAKYESEWGGDMSKWDALDPLILEGKLDWKAEKIRIKSLLWWPKVAAKVKGFPTSPEAYHFHPIGLMSNFFGVSTSSNLDDLIRQIGDIIAHGEGGYESYNSGTKGVKNDRVGHSFLHPATGTVTNKTINQILATEPLSGNDENRFFATGKYQTIFNTLRTAKTSMGLTGNEKYDAAMQERVFREYLIKKAGGGALARFVIDGKGTIDDAQHAAAKEWASIASPSGYKIKDGRVSNGSLSYHESAANHANKTSSSNLRAILQEILSRR
jgi:hypothetical protein